MRKTRITVEGIDAVVVLGIGVIAGAGAAIAGLSPTGTVVIDQLLVIAASTFAVWAMSAMPWWAGLVGAAIITALADRWWVIALGVIAVALAAWLGARREPQPVARAAVGALIIQVASRLDSVGPWTTFGLTSAVAIVIVIVVAAFGFRRHTHHHRVVMWWIIGGIGGYFAISLVGLVVASVLADDSLRAGNRSARAGLEHFQNGDLQKAADSFESAANSLAAANSQLAQPWTYPAALVPVVAQHRSVATGITGDGARAAARIADVLRVVDYDALSPRDGRIDIDAVMALQEPVTRLADAIITLDDTLTRNDSPWLVAAAVARVDALRDDVAEQRRGAENAVAALEQAPSMLGRDQPRRYFVAFTTPVEARASGGFMGNWAELRVDDGVITMSRFGRTLDLNSTCPDGSAAPTLPDVTTDYVTNYGTFIFADREARRIGPAAWSNITTSPDFPTVAATIADLYPQCGGSEVDGVFMLDVLALARLLEITGPITVDDVTGTGTGTGTSTGTALTLDSSNAAQFLFTDQYATDNEQARKDALEAVARTTLTTLLDTTFPSPPQVATIMSPMAHQGRFTAWATRPDEQDIFRRLGLDGALPAVTIPLDNQGRRANSDFGPSAYGDGLSFTFTNATGNKIDNYLDGTVAYDVDVDRDAGTVDGTVTITLRNSSPTSGWSEGVIGNELGLPLGTNRTWLSVYTALPVVSFSVDGADEGLRPTTELGWWMSSTLLDIAAGDTTVIRLNVRGRIDPDDEYRLTVRNPPLVRPFPVNVTYNGAPLGVPITEAGYHTLQPR